MLIVLDVIMDSQCASDAQVGSARKPAATWRLRLRGAAVSLAGLAVLVTGAFLSPAPSGMGTAEQLGLPPCSWPIRTGWPCPTCGMTTSVSAMVHGRIIEAFRAQPFGVVFSLFLVIMVVAGGAELLSGRDVLARMRMGWWWLGAALAGIIAGWGIKIAAGAASGEFPIR